MTWSAFFHINSIEHQNLSKICIYNVSEYKLRTMALATHPWDHFEAISEEGIGIRFHVQITNGTSLLIPDIQHMTVSYSDMLHNRWEVHEQLASLADDDKYCSLGEVVEGDDEGTQHFLW